MLQGSPNSGDEPATTNDPPDPGRTHIFTGIHVSYHKYFRISSQAVQLVSAVPLRMRTRRNSDSFHTYICSQVNISVFCLFIYFLFIYLICSFNYIRFYIYIYIFIYLFI